MASSDNPSPMFRPEIPRRVHSDIPNAPRPGQGDLPVASAAPEPKTMFVGREIFLVGEISACDRLVVEGTVEAKLNDTRMIDVAQSGLIKGNAEIEEADIRGRFEGTLTVRGRLLIRATGHVTGKIRYGEVEIERGGRISGDIDSIAELSKPVETVPAAAG